jgi:hypothetical protein
MFVQACLLAQIKQHPMEYISKTLYAASCFLWCLGTSNLSCDWKLYEINALTIFYSSNVNYQIRSEQATLWLRWSLQTFSYQFYASSNICLTLEIFQMLSRPFDSAERRLKKFQVLCLGFSFIMTIVFFVSKEAFFWTQFGLLLVYITVLICTTAYCVMTLPHSSACPETKKIIWRRHIYWSSIFIFSNAAVAYANNISVFGIQVN